ncbi:hypothetical protein IFM89_036151 [Coptis chinensis]|uniref:Leucine-rich repeat-containing N-terminal plant-type domain-containing protein n=1 Tax=Coptis chinensis TaxID=261450 RepID=A0A835H1N1_9MAGN|nr:hypothetical protein IFM89_036151 [Coptis chinensis]
MVLQNTIIFVLMVLFSWNIYGLSLHCHENERQALLDFKKGVIADPFNRLSSWVGQDCCKWQGVGCNNKTGNVVKLDLRNPFPSSDYLEVIEVNSSLLELEHLNYLDLSQNNFTGIKIPKFFGSFQKLKYLNLSFAMFGGIVPHDLGNLSMLQHLDLSGLNLSSMSSGSLPSSLPSLSGLVLSNCGLDEFPSFLSHANLSLSLVNLDLSNNNLKGSIPQALLNMTSLEYLNLAFNELSSDVPIINELKKLYHLETLDLMGNRFEGKVGDFENSLSSSMGYSLKTLKLGANKFSGHLPNWLYPLKNLEILDFSANYFDGPIPESVGALLRLKELDLSDNSLTGVVSEVHLAKLSKLKFLSLSTNFLSLKIRSNWIPPFQLDFIYMSHCAVGPQFPEWLRTQTTLMVLHMKYSNISDSLSNCYGNLSSLVTLDLSHNQIYGKVPPLPRHVTILDLSNNKISGPIPKNIGHMIPFVEFLNLSNNSLNGTIPGSLCKMQNLVVLDLAFNTLSGTIPSSIGQLQKKLETLHLNNNKFHGEFPSGLRNHTRLGILDLGENALSGEIPWWIGKDLVALQILSLRSNRFNGTIPPKVCDMANLHILDVSRNNLSGTIPTCFRNLSGMLLLNGSISFGQYTQEIMQVIKGIYIEYRVRSEVGLPFNLDLSSNNFVGQIPEELTLLTGLTGLNLSRNHLTGKMPENIGQMKRLESLDFSSNHLSGSIPPSISAISTLETLNLSYNNLSGPIPTGSQLQTFENSSYIGNSELCGFPLQRKCFHDEQSHAPSHNDRKGQPEGDHLKINWFYIGIVSGFAVGNWGVCAVLLFKKTWRCAYFRFCDDIYDWLFVFVAVRVVRLKIKLKCSEVQD